MPRTAKIEVNSELLAHAHVSKAWPFEEARKVLSRLKRIPKPTGAIIFETGYGPSGLPHIGTFGEVARTTMVRHAFRVLTEDKVPTRLIAFSDDMDGLRKVPDNIPNKEMVAEHLGKPLTQVPDPFGVAPELRPPQQCPAQGLPRYVRLRLRISVGDRVLHDRPLRCGAAQGAPSLRRDPRRDPADARARASRHLQPLPADLADHRQSAAGAVRRSRSRLGLDRLQGPGHRQAHPGSGHARPLQAAMEGRLGDALGGARRRLRDGGQGPDRTRSASRGRSAASSAASSPRASTTSCFSTRTARRSRSRAAMGSPSRSG